VVLGGDTKKIELNIQIITLHF